MAGSGFFLRSCVRPAVRATPLLFSFAPQSPGKTDKAGAEKDHGSRFGNLRGMRVLRYVRFREGGAVLKGKIGDGVAHGSITSQRQGELNGTHDEMIARYASIACTSVIACRGNSVLEAVQSSGVLEV